MKLSTNFYEGRKYWKGLINQSPLTRYEVHLVEEVCSLIVISTHRSFYSHRMTIRRRISLVFTLWPLWCHLMRSFRFKMAGETRKWFLLELITDGLLKLVEKSNQITQKRSMWEQLNRNEKMNYAIVESMDGTTRYKHCSERMKHSIRILNKGIITQWLNLVFLITNLSRNQHPI